MSGTTSSCPFFLCFCVDTNKPKTQIKPDSLVDITHVLSTSQNKYSKGKGRNKNKSKPGSFLDPANIRPVQLVIWSYTFNLKRNVLKFAQTERRNKLHLFWVKFSISCWLSLWLSWLLLLLLHLLLCCGPLLLLRRSLRLLLRFGSRASSLDLLLLGNSLSTCLLDNLRALGMPWSLCNWSSLGHLCCAWSRS